MFVTVNSMHIFYYVQIHNLQVTDKMFEDTLQL